VVILTRSKETADEINLHHRNPNYLSDFELPTNITATINPQEALQNVDYIVHSIPIQVRKLNHELMKIKQSTFCQATPDYLKNLSPLIPSNVPIISSSKVLHKNNISTLLTTNK
jgi:glycerol-3-phosphate dehydrogenase